MSDSIQASPGIYQLLGGDPKQDWHIHGIKQQGAVRVALCGFVTTRKGPDVLPPGDRICPVCECLHAALDCNCGVGGEK